MEHINITRGTTLVYCRNIKAKAPKVIIMLRSLQNERERKLRTSKNNYLDRDNINNPAHYECLLSQTLHSNYTGTNACGLRSSTQCQRQSDHVQFHLHSTTQLHGEVFNSAHGEL